MSDLIRREDVNDLIKQICDVCGEGEKYNGVMCRCCRFDDFIGVVDNIPSAEPEQKPGKWIEYPDCLGYDGAYSDDHIVCSECEHVFSICDNCTEEFDFCPHCGADMRGE